MINYYLDKYKFCPLCASTLNKKSNFWECAKCHYQIFDNGKAAVNVIIENKDKELLVVTRAKNPFKGWYDFPGGFSERGETLEQTAQREIKEELSVDLKIGKYLGSTSIFYEYQNLYVNIVTAFFTGTVDISKIAVNDDAASYKFLLPDKIFTERVCYPEANLKILKQYLESRS